MTVVLATQQDIMNSRVCQGGDPITRCRAPSFQAERKAAYVRRPLSFPASRAGTAPKGTAPPQ